MTAPHPHSYKFPLGVKLRDLITGFSGTATGVATYLTGCDQFCLQPAAKDDGSLPTAMWFDDARLERIPTEPPVNPFTAVGEAPTTPGASAKQAGRACCDPVDASSQLISIERSKEGPIIARITQDADAFQKTVTIECAIRALSEERQHLTAQALNEAEQNIKVKLRTGSTISQALGTAR